MALDLDRIKKKQAATKSSGGNFFKPQEGRNIVRVFSFKHKVTKADVKAGHFNKKHLGKTVDELDRAVTRVFINRKPYLIKSASDPIARKHADDVSTQYMLNVVDVMGAEKKVKQFGAGKTVYNAIIDSIMDPDYGEGILGCNGRDFVITYHPDKEGANRYSVRLRDESKCTKLPASLAKGVYDYYDPAVYETLGEPQNDAPDDEEDEEEDIDTDEDTDDEDLDEEEDSEEDEDDEDLDEEEDEDDEDIEDEDLNEDDEDDEPEPPKKKKPVKKASTAGKKKPQKKVRKR